MEQHLRRVARCNKKTLSDNFQTRKLSFKKRKFCVFIDVGAQRRKKVAEMFNFADVASESQSESCAAVVKE